MSPTTNSSSPNKQQIDWQPSAYANKIQLAGMAIILKDPGLSNEMSVQPKVDPVRTDFDGVGPILSGF